MKQFIWAVVAALLISACTVAQPTSNTPGASTATPDTPAPETPTTVTPVTPADVAAHQDSLWACRFCGGTQAWQFENGEAELIDLPVAIYNAYGYSPATDRLLYSSPTESVGRGPAQIAVNNLWLLDVASGTTTPIFEEQVIVEADLAPDGEHFAYVLATDTTYELRWRALDGGEDTLLASDVAFTFAVSPQGDKVAFTRESNYDLPVTPGLYVVDVNTGEEIMMADADRAGAGSIDDKPAWSPSATRILLPTYGTTAAPGIVLAAADGSGAITVGFDPATRDEAWYEASLANALWVTDSQFLATAAPGSMNQQLGGELYTYLFQLNESADTIIAGAEVSPGMFAVWDVPGARIWVQVGAEMQSVPLPQLAAP